MCGGGAAGAGLRDHVAVLSPDAEVFRPTLVLVDEDSLAAKAGLRQWDLVEAIDGVSTEGLDLPAARDLLTRGEGDTITFTVGRAGELSDIVVPRAQRTREPAAAESTINATW